MFFCWKGRAVWPSADIAYRVGILGRYNLVSEAAYVDGMEFVV